MRDSSTSANGILAMGEKIVAYFTRRKLLYKLVGWLIAVSLISELGAFDLESKIQIDYRGISESYSWFIAASIAWIVDVFAGGYDLTSVIIKSLILTICLYIDYRVQTKEGNKKTIWNISFGINNNINQNFDMKDDE